MTSFPNIHRSDLFTPLRKSPLRLSCVSFAAISPSLGVSTTFVFQPISSSLPLVCFPLAEERMRGGERERRDDGAMEKASRPTRIHSYAAASLLAFRHCVRSHTRMCAPPPFDSCILATSGRRGRRKRAVNGDEPAATGERRGYARGTRLSTDE